MAYPVYPNDVQQVLRGPQSIITKIGERPGSGKITLNKSGHSGERIWQIPWFLYPRFCDWLLGRVAPNPNGFPQCHLPDVFSANYPWLYAVEANVEGEDLLGIDRFGRAFYRTAVVKAKYMPLEQGNSFHLQSQIVTVPAARYAFVGTNPWNRIGATQTIKVKVQGALNTIGQTFRLRFSDVNGAWSTVTQNIPLEATPHEMMNIVRQALGLTPLPTSGQVTASVPLDADTVIVSGDSRERAWDIRIKSNTGIYCNTDASLNTLLTAGAPIAATLFGRVGPVLGIPNTVPLPIPPGAPSSQVIDDWRSVAIMQRTSYLVKLDFAINFQGSFQLGLGYTDGSTAISNPINFTNEIRYPQLISPLAPLVNGKTAATHDPGYGFFPSDQVLAPVDQIRCSSLYIQTTPSSGAPTYSEFAGYSFAGQWHTRQDNDYKIFSRVPAALENTIVDPPPLNDTTRYVLWLLFSNFANQAAGITSVSISNGPPPVPSIVVDVGNPTIVDRLDHPAGKVVCQGEFTFVRHQVLFADALFLVRVIGCVNMFTFMGFPPWTLLLQGMEAKQMRLPNGQPCFDITFKFAYAPNTHQALFRPATGQWEFVRAVVQVTLPNNVMVPQSPLNPQNGVAILNANAINGAVGNFDPSPPPRTVPFFVDPASGHLVAGLTPPTPNTPTSNPPSSGGPFSAPADSQPSPDGPPILGTDQPPVPVNSPANENTSEDQAETQKMVEQVNYDEEDQDQEEPDDLFSDFEDIIDQMDQDALGEIDPFGLGLPSSTTYAAYNAGVLASPDEWNSFSLQLSELIHNTIAATDGQFPEDQRAGASGAAYDIAEAVAEGAPWITGLNNGGIDTSGNAGARSGNAAMSHAANMNAASCGVGPLSPQNLMGQPGNPATIYGPTPAPNAAANAANVGAATSTRSIRIFDLGFIYPIADLTPIIWMQ